MFFRHTVGEWFSHWKSNKITNTVSSINTTSVETVSIKEVHLAKVEKMREFNMDRSENLIHKQQKMNYMRAWRNVTKW